MCFLHRNKLDYIISGQYQLLSILFRRGDEAQKYKRVATTKHDSFLDSFLPVGSYKKLYSYTHLINGFALHAESEKVPSSLLLIFHTD
jgi:hypothetical protein